MLRLHQLWPPQLYYIGSCLFGKASLRYPLPSIEILMGKMALIMFGRWLCRKVCTNSTLWGVWKQGVVHPDRNSRSILALFVPHSVLPPRDQYLATSSKVDREERPIDCAIELSGGLVERFNTSLHPPWYRAYKHALTKDRNSLAESDVSGFRLWKRIYRWATNIPTHQGFEKCVILSGAPGIYRRTSWVKRGKGDRSAGAVLWLAGSWRWTIPVPRPGLPSEICLALTSA